MLPLLSQTKHSSAHHMANRVLPRSKHRRWPAQTRSPETNDGELDLGGIRRREA
jgi:hypothetical protein